MTSFTAIDFETAGHGRDSACAVGAVVVERGRIVERYYQLIRPPVRQVMFSHVHGLTWADLKDAPAFAEMWPELRRVIEAGEYLVAHNAPFDRGVLHGCCAAAGITPPPQRFECTVQIARRTWALPSNRLPAVCDYLGIPLNHHNAMSDAEACAHIALAAMAGPA